MSEVSPILDQPQSIDHDQLLPGPINRLANQDLVCAVDANSDPYDIFWPWAQQFYARSIRIVISDWQDGELPPLVTRFFPGHQETIIGTEGMIVTKRLVTPAHSLERSCAALAAGVPGRGRSVAANGDRHRLG